MTSDDAIVHVRSGWRDWDGAEVRAGDLEDVHWRRPSGAPTRLLHAYLRGSSADGPQEPGSRTGVPARVLVCILRHDTVPSLYVELADRASDHRGSDQAADATGRPAL